VARHLLTVDHMTMTDLGPGDAPLITVAIASPHSGVRDALGFLLGSENDLRVVATLADERAAGQYLMRERPDVFVLASSALLRDDAAELRRLCSLAAESVVILVSTASHEAYNSVARAAGAMTLLALDGPPETLLAAVRSVSPAATADPLSAGGS
jgi:DNA-binding NarL/FixJ family response regulator